MDSEVVGSKIEHVTNKQYIQNLVLKLKERGKWADLVLRGAFTF